MPSTPFHVSINTKSFFSKIPCFGASGIVISMMNLRNGYYLVENLKLEKQQIMDCSNYGNIYYGKIEKGASEMVNGRIRRYENSQYEKENFNQIVLNKGYNADVQNCNEYGKIIRK